MWKLAEEKMKTLEIEKESNISQLKKIFTNFKPVTNHRSLHIRDSFLHNSPKM